jgi:hypothetical protein
MGACSGNMLIGSVEAWKGSLLQGGFQRSEAILSRHCERLACTQKDARKHECELHDGVESCLLDWSTKMMGKCSVLGYEIRWNIWSIQGLIYLAIDQYDRHPRRCVDTSPYSPLT